MKKIKRHAVAPAKVFTESLAGRIIIKKVPNPYRSGRKKKSLQHKGKIDEGDEPKIYRMQIGSDKHSNI